MAPGHKPARPLAANAGGPGSGATGSGSGSGSTEGSHQRHCPAQQAWRQDGPGAVVSVTGNAVDPFPDEVGVAVVARVLLDHVQVDPADVPGALGVVTVAGHDIIKLRAGHRSEE